MFLLTSGVVFSEDDCKTKTWFKLGMGSDHFTLYSFLFGELFPRADNLAISAKRSNKTAMSHDRHAGGCIAGWHGA